MPVFLAKNSAHAYEVSFLAKLSGGIKRKWVNQLVL
jgi:hypothetical protein